MSKFVDQFDPFKIRAAKANAVSNYMTKAVMAQRMYDFGQDYAIPMAQRHAIHDTAAEFEKVVRAALSAEVGAVTLPLKKQIALLEAATLEDKRKILRTMPIITVPVAAAFLGTTEEPLYSYSGNCRKIFSGLYTWAQCYSMDDLIIFAANPAFVTPFVFQPKPEEDVHALTVLDNVVFVDWEVAMALTDLSYTELNMQVREAANSRRPYRLADLEKIRVAKLNAAH